MSFQYDLMIIQKWLSFIGPPVCVRGSHQDASGTYRPTIYLISLIDFYTN